MTSGADISPNNKEKLFSNSVDAFINMIDVSEDKDSGIFTIKITSEEPDLSYELNAGLIEEIKLHHENISKQRHNKTLHFIMGRIEDTAKELQNAKSLRDFRGRNRRIENSPVLLEEERLSRKS